MTNASSVKRRLKNLSKSSGKPLKVNKFPLEMFIAYVV